MADPQTRAWEISAIKAAAQDLKVKNLLVVTMNEKQLINEGDFQIRVVPFYEWALRFE